MSTRYSTTRMLQNSAPAVTQRKRGFTVLEVLVAMFILLVGGLAILNIFPPALRVIRGSENREIAISMTQSKLETYANEPATIPDATYNDDGTGVWSEALTTTAPFQPIAATGTRLRNKSLPSAPADFNNSSLDRFKRIVGERHRVLKYTIGGSDRFYVLTNFSYQQNSVSLSVEDEVEGVTADVNGQLDFSNATLASTGAVYNDAVNNNPTLPPSLSFSNSPSPTSYYVSYRWLEDFDNNATNDVVQGVSDEKQYLTPADLVLHQRERAKTPNFANRVVAGLVKVKIKRQAGVSFNLLDTIYIGDVSRSTLTGFVPLTGVSEGQEITVDYSVQGWNWLINDSFSDTATSKDAALLAPVPVDNARDIKLPVSTLRTSPGLSPFNSLVYFTTPTLPVAVPPVIPQPQIGFWDGNANGAVLNVSSSSATVNVYSNNNANTPRIRSAYQTSRNWTNQISVAAKSYLPFDNDVAARPINEREPWREYSWTPGVAGNATIYFRASEAGKTVLVSFRYAGGLVSNQVVPIERDIKPVNNVFGVVGAVPTAQAVLMLPNGSATANATAILSVRGASIRSRTAWIENNNYVQEIKEDYRPLTD